jgi:nucleoside-diphosphate-sugar epimerase
LKVLITGASGFLGQHLIKHLKAEHEVYTFSSSGVNDFLFDITKTIPSLPYFDMVIHAAGKAHSIPKSIEDSNKFFNVNVEGTKNLLKSLDANKPKQLVFISSVSVYGLDEGTLINENSPLLGSTPYAKSKIQAEDFVIKWGNLNDVNITIFRLPLIVGINPPGNLGKMIKAIRKGRYFKIGDGTSRKSMILADNLGIFLNTIDLNTTGVFNITDGYHPSFAEMEGLICNQLNKPKPIKIPFFVAKILGAIGDFIPFFPINSNTIRKIVNELTFDDSKARIEINWKSASVLKNYKVLHD